MNNNIWIRIAFNNCGTFEGREDFVKELKQICVVQERDKWYPAACTGTECIVEFLLNMSLADLIVQGLAWDALKKTCNSIWKSFNKFISSNQGIDFQKLTFSFNETTVVVNEPLDNLLSFLHDLYSCLHQHWPILKQKGINNIDKIELPVMPNDSNSDILKYVDFDIEETPENCMWKITYNYGLNVCYYNPVSKQIIPQ